MYDERILRAVGRGAAWAIADQARWVHRRVETVSFPSPDDVVVRRRLSIDFTIPSALRPATGRYDQPDAPEFSSYPPDGDSDGPPDWSAAVTEPSLYYVPLSVLRKWPPVPHLDLRIGSNEPIPLLTRKQNGVTDAALLSEVARRRLVIRAQLQSDDRLDPQLAQLVERIATSGEAAATVALGHLRRPATGTDDAAERQRLALSEDRQFLDIAGGLLSKTILWLRVVGLPHERHIVKLSYDARVEDFDELKTFSAVAFGWEGFNITLEVPHIGNAGSYHLQFSVPAPMKICDAQVELTSRGLSAEDGAEPQVPAREDSGSENTDGPALPDGSAAAANESQMAAAAALEMSAEPDGQRAHFYVTGERPLYVAEAKVSLLLDKGGPILGAFIASALITAMLAAYWVGRDAVVEVGGAAFGVLFLVPGLLAYLIVRPGQHVAAGRLFKGVKLLVLASGLLPLLAAIGLVLNGSGGVTNALCVWLGSLTILSVLNTLLLGLSLFLPRGVNQTPLTSAPAAPDIEEEVVPNPEELDKAAAYAALSEQVKEVRDKAQLRWLRLHAETIRIEDAERAELLAEIDQKLAQGSD